MTKFGKLAGLRRQVRDTARHQGCSPLWLLPRFIRLYGPGRYSPGEIFRLELLGLPAASLGEFISKERLISIQMRLNPVALTDQTEDKAVFYRLCEQACLPIPAVLGELDLDARTAACERLAAAPGGEMIIKPAQGYHGLGVIQLNHVGGRFIAPHGPVYSPDALLAKLAETPGFRRWLIQRRVTNHPDVDAISPSRALQTLRVVTFVGDDDQPHVIASQWRLAPRDAVKDNFDDGCGGNYLCNIDVNAGRIVAALQLSPTGTRMERLSKHPVSGVALEGLVPPLWQAVTSLALRAAPAMLPTRSIGWDIGLTPEGPVIIEANRYWDPQNMDGGMGARLRFMAARTDRFRYA